MESVRVTPGILPPTIKTTPNSPMVWAKHRAVAVTKPETDSGTTTRQNVLSLETPSTADAASTRESTLETAAANGCTANGRLYNTEPMTNPSKVKARVCPVMDCHHRPSGERCPNAMST